MLTVTKLARRCGVSRTALLYYESIGLMPRPQRSGGNYRCYGEADLRRLLQIRAYREAGLKIDDIRAILKNESGSAGNRRGRSSEAAAARARRRDRNLARTPAGDPQTSRA